MKILEAQSAILTNYEVYNHLINQKARYEAGGRNRRGPGNLETVVRELLDYFRTTPSPLAETTYSPAQLRTLIVRLRPYDLTKAEVLMIINLRPTTTEALAVAIEEMSERFSEEQHFEIADIVGEVLGKQDGEAVQRMRDSANDARDRQNALSTEMEVGEPA